MKELNLPISLEQLLAAKKQQKEFDAQKTYNKFKCDTNYIGLLGEMVLNDYLEGEGVDFKWVKFNKQGWNDPDFIIHERSIDLKTTFSDVMWIQEEKFDIYLYAQINRDQNELTLKGWLPKEEITKSKQTGINCKKVTRGNRHDLVFEPADMFDIEWLSFIGVGVGA